MFSLLVCKAKSVEHKVVFIAWVRDVSRNWQQTAQEGSRKMAGQGELFMAKMPGNTSPVAFVYIDTRPSEEPSEQTAWNPGVLRYAKRSITNSSVSTASLFLVTKNIQSNSEQQTLLKSTQVLTKSTFTSTIVTLVTFS